MKNIKVVGLSVILASSLSMVSALDLGGLVGATKDLADNTSYIASGKKQKEGEAKKAQKAEADAKRSAEDEKIIKAQMEFTELCKREYHKQKVPFQANTDKETKLFMRSNHWDNILKDVNKGKYDTRDCFQWLTLAKSADGEGFKKETAKYDK